MLSLQEEQSLVSAVCAGDRAAFTRLVRAYQRLVLHLVSPLISNQQDRDDVCQEVFIKVYQQLHRFQARSRLATWIGQIAYHTAVNFLRRRKMPLLEDLLPGQRSGDDENSELTAALADDAAAQPDAQLMRKQAAGILFALAERLPPLQNAVLRLFHTDELSLEEIADILSLPLNTVKSHLFRARKNLKQALLKHPFLRP